MDCSPAMSVASCSSSSGSECECDSIRPRRSLDALVALVTSGLLEADEPASRGALCELSALCKALRQRILPLLFASVKWPHPRKSTPEGGLEFFPRGLWGYIRSFSLQWPDEWSRQEPPPWGLYHIPLTGDYDAGASIDPLIESLVQITTIETFLLDCPFFPPNRLLEAIFRFPKLRGFQVRDTPLYMTDSWGLERFPQCPHLEAVKISPAPEALKVGNEVGDLTVVDSEYQLYPHRKKYIHNSAFARGATKRMLDKVASTRNLSRLDVSTGLCDFATLMYRVEKEKVEVSIEADSDEEGSEGHRMSPEPEREVRCIRQWDRLRTLVITGPVPPKPLNTYDPWQGHVLDVVDIMPQLKDLRLLLAQEGGRAEGIPQLALAKGAHAHPSVLSRLTSLAVSLAVDLTDALQWTTSLKSLSILAISQVPDCPTAIKQATATKLLGEGTLSLEKLRIIVEDEPTPDFCGWLAGRFPDLKHLELEWRNCVDGETPWGWCDFADALGVLPKLSSLRLALKFPLTSNVNRKYEIAYEFAQTLPSLRTFGFEYRNELGKDVWMDWDITRLHTTPTATCRKKANVCLTRYLRVPDVWDVKAA